jgi:tetratricopeptide (TPR) repeat protein
MRTIFNIVLLSVLSALLFPMASWAQNTWYSAYENALEDISAGHWEQSAENLRQALELKPDPELNARTYGVWRSDYFPYYFLGLTWFNMGDYSRAVEFFDRSLEAGPIKRHPELFEQLTSYRQTAVSRIENAGPEREIDRRIEEELNRGLQLERLGELEEALVKFESVLTLAPGNALATEHMREIRAMLAHKDSLLALNRRVEALLAEGESFLQLGNLTRSRKSFEAATAISSDSRAISLRDSVDALLAGRAEQNLRLGKQVKQLIEQGRLAKAAGRLDEARRNFDRALNLDHLNEQATRLIEQTDSLLAESKEKVLRTEMLSEARRLVNSDSLLAARDLLVRARELGKDSAVDSLYDDIESRITENERRFRLRDLPQLVLAGQNEATINVSKAKYIVSGNAMDDDGIVLILLELNSISSEIYRYTGTGQPYVRQDFEQVIELPPGTNRLKLTVFDGRNNNSATEKVLVYTPPPWKLPLVRYLLVLGILLCATAYYYLKRNTFHLLFNKLRRRPFMLISPNPFIVGNPIRSREMFFGREDDFRFVKNKVDNEKYGSLIVLFGERRAGKTSVLYQLLGGRLGPRYLPVFLDMQAMAINNDSEFLGRVAEITTDQLGARLGEVDLSAFEDRLRNPYPLFEKFIDHALETIGEDRLLFMVDEYELIEDKVAEGKIRKDIFHFLSGLVEHKTGLYLIFAGNHRLQERRHGFWEPLLQRCDYRNISYLTPNDTRRLIQEPVRGKVFFIGTTVRDIMRLTAGQPFYTQLVCRNMVELLNAERRNYFYEADITDVVSEIIDNPPPQLIYFWAGMETVEKLVLSTVAEAARGTNSFPDLDEMQHALKKFSVNVPESDLKKICEQMTVREILERGPRESYRFRMDLYRLWIREDHNLYNIAREFDRETISR